MAIRNVKLQDTGEFTTNNLAYRASNGKYYSSKQAYDLIQHKSEMRQLCIDEVKRQIGYEDFMIIPKMFLKKLKEWEDYTYDVIYLCIKNSQESVQWALNHKEFKSESGKMAYLCCIWENGLNDAYADFAREKKKENENKSITIEAGAIDIVSNISSSKKNSDASSFLGDLWN